MQPSWEDLIKAEYAYPYFRPLLDFVAKERLKHTIYPPKGAVFKAFQLCKFADVKVVIVGQDPYHGANQAMGLSFSVAPGIKIPPSLQNIFKEQGQNPQSGDLSAWAKQGVFLLNRILTVQAGQPMSHANRGWEIFTDHMLAHLYASERPLVFMLWGSAAQKLKPAQPKKEHLFLCTSHPSPLAAYRGFLGCGHFELANEFLIKHQLSPIDWRLP